MSAPATTTRLPKADPLDATLAELLSSGVAEGDHGQQVAIREFAVGPDAGDVLSRAAAVIQPQVTVEVGCASAVSSLFLAKGWRPRRAHIIDPRQSSHWKNIGVRSIQRAGLTPIVNFYEQPAHVVLPRLLERGERIQLAFLDGWHMLDFVLVEAFYCDFLLDIGGVIILHDLRMPGLQHFAAFWVSNRMYEPVALHDGKLLHRPIDETSAPYPPIRERFAGSSRYFIEQVAPYVHESTLILQKKSADRRVWNEFHDFV